MGLFSFLKNDTDTTSITAVADAVMIPASEINDPVFHDEMMGQTIGFTLKNGKIASPADGILEVMFPTGHAFGIRMADGTALLVHIGIDTVKMNGRGFNIKAKQGEKVKAGQIMVEVDLDQIKAAGYDSTTMLIVTEPIKEEKISFIEFGEVARGQKISK